MLIAKIVLSLVGLVSIGTLWAAEKCVIADPPYWVLRTMQVITPVCGLALVVLRFMGV